jgi:hypothetical protein
MARLHGSLRLEEVLDASGRTVTRAGRTVWRLLEPLEWVLDGANGTDSLVVPAGFSTDLASIPWAMRWLIPASGPWQRAAVVHDWLYSNSGVVDVIEQWFGRRMPMTRYFDRARCDAIFMDAMREAGVDLPTRSAMWLAVRVGGWAGWGQ